MTAPDSLPKSTILVVDDSPENLLLLKEILADLDVQVETAESGAEAIRLAMAHPPNLVVLDVMMPGLSGYDVCRLMRATPSLAELPIIFLTALSHPRDELQALRLGAVDFLSKPVHAASFVAKISNHLRLSTARAEAARAAQLAGAVAAAVTMGHEVNNPLQALLSECEILISKIDPRDAAIRSTAEQIRGLTLRIADVVRTMTSLADPVFEKYAPKIDMIDIRKSRSNGTPSGPSSGETQ